MSHVYSLWKELFFSKGNLSMSMSNMKVTFKKMAVTGALVFHKDILFEYILFSKIACADNGLIRPSSRRNSRVDIKKRGKLMRMRTYYVLLKGLTRA